MPDYQAIFGQLTSALGQALDPRLDHDKDAPRAAIIAKRFVEYFFKIAGYFLLLCLIVGVTLSSCPDNSALAFLPLVTGALFFFYIVLTTIGIPMFALIRLIRHSLVRRSVAWSAVFVMLVLTNSLLSSSPVLDLLVVYVSKLFPAALECTTNPISITSP